MKKPFTPKSKNFKPKSSAFGNKKKPFFNKDNADGERKRPFFNKDNADGERKRPFFNKDNADGERKRPFFNKDNADGERKRPVFNKDNADGERKRPVFNKDNADGERKRPFFNKDNADGERKRPFFNKDNADRKPNRNGKPSGKFHDKFGAKNKFSKPQTNSLISVEYVIEILKKNGVINLSKLNLSHNDTLAVLNKIDLLNKFNLLTSKDGNTFNFVTHEVMPNLPKFVIINNISNLQGNNYMVKVKTITNKDLGENNFVINKLKEDLLDRNILVELTKENEKIIANPLLYLSTKNLVLPQTTTNTKNKDEVVGIAKIYNSQFTLIPLNYKSHYSIKLLQTPETLEDGHVVKAELIDQSTANYLQTLAQEKDSTKLSMLSVYQYNLPTDFSQQALDEANNVAEWTTENRNDVTSLPLVTIDDEDAKDFDDAIFAKKISDNPLQYKVYVAIADVSACVPQNSALDTEAYTRGNSVYLPGFVIPMLPHQLSNNLCSLNPNVNRGCMLAEITINRNGEIEDYTFSRAIMNSKARLTYTLVQNAIDNNFNINQIQQPSVENISINKVSQLTTEIIDTTLKPIYEVYKLLNDAKKRRKALEITSQDTKIILDNEDNILNIVSRTQNTANKIVEEFMIAANVAAAKFLAKNNVSNLTSYRVHNKPTPEKLLEFAKVLKTFNIYTKVPENPSGDFFNDIIKEYGNEGFINSLNENVLRAQTQAVYSTHNVGHYGLALKEYSHFTSPIRRYSDLMVHRLINFVLDANNNSFNYSPTQVQEICEHISKTERIAFFAEMASKERILTKWLQSKLNTNFSAQVSSITKSGMFINLTEVKASGLVPMRLISKGYAKYNFNKNTITNPDTNHTYKLGEMVEATLIEANEYTGMLTFSLVDNNAPVSKRTKRRRRK